MVKDLKLTGLSVNPTSPSESYCMIEDITKGITHFLKVGETLNGLKVTEIHSDGALLQYQNETTEMRW
jgi:hypothetical protein